MRYRLPVLFLATTAVLAACGKSQDEKNTDTAAAINQAIAKSQGAAAQEDPWTAAATLARETRAALLANDGCVDGACTRGPTVLRAEEARWTLVEAALDRSMPEALASVFAGDAIPNPPAVAETNPHRFDPAKVSRWAEALIAGADAAGGATASQRSLILAAGYILETGSYVERDTYRATGLYARAWLAGHTPAAGLAARAYLGVGDIRNAYLWTNRCVNDCGLANLGTTATPRGLPDPRLTKDSLQAMLTPEAAAQAQQAARDRTVLELGGTVVTAGAAAKAKDAQ